MFDLFVRKIKAVITLCLTSTFFFSATVCRSYEFQIVNHFKSPLEGGVGDLTYNADGYLYATKKTTLGYEDRIYKIDPHSGKFIGFFEHPSDPINQLKYITSCNSNIFVDHYPILFNYVIYKIYPEEEIWTTFFEPENEVYGGIACNGSNLILTEEGYIYTISLFDQEEVSRDKFITLQTYNGMTWDGEYLCALTSNESNRAILHRIDSGVIIEEITLPSTLTNCRGLTYDGEAFWTYVTGALSPYSEEVVQIKIISSQILTTTISTTTTLPAPTTTSSSGSTTTTSSPLCLSELLYGDDSGEVELLRYFRENVLNHTIEGQELIKLYYQWSPVIVKAMEEDEGFKENVKEMIDGVLELIEGEAE
ncbi:MAG: hypothetical protein JRJ00_07050 [Deltaproteobacteria bacterium]|nr:hypothetical protein [Deltaproteobacteria bacterium]